MCRRASIGARTCGEIEQNGSAADASNVSRHGGLDRKAPWSAGWFQAVGAILAVAVAIWVPARQHKVAAADAEANRRLKARSLALRLLPALQDFAPLVKTAIENTRAARLEGPGPVVMRLVNAATVGAPEELANDVDQLYLLGEKAGFPTQQLFAFLNKHTRELERAQQTGAMSADRSLVPVIHKGIIESLEQIDRLLATSIERVRAVHNGEW